MVINTLKDKYSKTETEEIIWNQQISVKKGGKNKEVWWGSFISQYHSNKFYYNIQKKY